MSIELLPLGKTCNIRCTYCYQQAERAFTHNSAPPYSMEKMKAGLLAEGVKAGSHWSLFGGESLLLPLADIEELARWSQEIGAHMGVQTNGTILTDHHVRLFKQYGISVGVSMDGPGELNGAREACDPKATAGTTALSERNLRRFLAEGISTSLIVTLSAVNCGDEEKCAALIAWLLSLRDAGLKYVNLHLLEPHGDPDLILPPARLIAVLRTLRRELVGFREVLPFADLRKTLLSDGNTKCIFNFCDPYTTPSVQGVDGQGHRGNCGRTNHDGIAYIKSQTTGHERQLALYLTPKEEGGCGGCRFFLACGGGNCPGEGEKGDWRNRTVHCETLTALFSDVERELAQEGREPLSMSLRRPALEAEMIARWDGTCPPGAQSEHGDLKCHGDIPHGDIPHGDSHGDHTDHGGTK